MMIKIAAVGRHGAGWELTGAGADPDRLGEPGRGIAAEFGCVEEPTAIVGEKSGKQHRPTAIGVEGFGDCSCKISPGTKPDRSASSPGALLAPSRLASWHDYSNPSLSRTPHAPWFVTWKHLRRCIDGFTDRVTIPVDALQLGAKQLAGLRVNILDFKPIGLIGWLIVSFLVRLVEGQPTQQQISEQVGAALLLRSDIFGAEAARRRGEDSVDSCSVGSRHLPGDIADAVGALDNCDATLSQCPAMSLRKGARLELHNQPEQPHGQLFRRPGLRGLDRLVIDGSQSVGFGNPTRHPIDHPDLLNV
jgi:hypothetical protein